MACTDRSYFYSKTTVCTTDSFVFESFNHGDGNCDGTKNGTTTYVGGDVCSVYPLGADKWYKMTITGIGDGTTTTTTTTPDEASVLALASIAAVSAFISIV